MFDKSAAIDADVFVLPDLSVVALTGADAARFAQAQFMNHVAALPAGQWQWNGWLTPKGRVVALFALIKRAEDALLAVLLDADPAEFCAALGRFVFRSKVKAAPCPALSVAGCFAAPRQARGSVVAEWEDGALELDFGAAGGARTLLLVGGGSFPASGELIERWRGFDLAHGLPRLNPGQAEHWTPQQLSLGRLNAYSVKKGCYPGQEIVARTHFLGQAKRGLVRLVADHAIEPGAGVTVGDAPPVPLLACCGHQALAVLALEATADERIGGQPVRREALLDGLAR